MSKVCEMCGKKRASGSNVSHSNRRTKRVFNPNLQIKSIIKNGQKIKLRICSRCIKMLGK